MYDWMNTWTTLHQSGEDPPQGPPGGGPKADGSMTGEESEPPKKK